LLLELVTTSGDRGRAVLSDRDRAVLSGDGRRAGDPEQLPSDEMRAERAEQYVAMT
jgi:hypothetical protein